MSKMQLGPYINFQGQAREALEFYHQVLGGKLDPQALRLEVNGAVLIGTDGHPSYPAKVGENMAVALGGADETRLTKVFNGLADGGRIKGPLTEQPGGARVGYVMDKFGINWVVSIEKA